MSFPVERNLFLAQKHVETWSPLAHGEFWKGSIKSPDDGHADCFKGGCCAGADVAVTSWANFAGFWRDEILASYTGIVGQANLRTPSTQAVGI